MSNYDDLDFDSAEVPEYNLDDFMEIKSEEGNAVANDDSIFYTYDHLSDTTFDTSILDNVIHVDMPMLPYQIELMNDTTSKIVGMVAGYG